MGEPKSKGFKILSSTPNREQTVNLGDKRAGEAGWTSINAQCLVCEAKSVFTPESRAGIPDTFREHLGGATLTCDVCHQSAPVSYQEIERAMSA